MAVKLTFLKISCILSVSTKNKSEAEDHEYQYNYRTCRAGHHDKFIERYCSPLMVVREIGMEPVNLLWYSRLPTMNKQQIC